jgi:AraC-like DNA-binding protein
MDKSKELLIDTDLTINEISDVVGYNDPFYFSKVFKRNTGLTPTAFRKLISIRNYKKT